MNKKYLISPRISALILALVLICSSFTGCFFRLGDDVPNDILIDEDSVVSQLAQNKSIPEFDTDTFANIELCFKTYYYTPLPDDDTLTENTVSAFFEYCYNEIDVNDKDAVTHALIDCYIYAVGDIYAFYRTPEELEDYNTDMGGSFVGIGVSVIRNDLENTILVTGVEPDSPAQMAGIQAGDYIVSVNGERIVDIGTKAVVDKIKGEVGTSVRVTVRRGEDEISFDMVRAVITETFVTYEFIENTKFVYIKIKSFKGDNSNNTALQFRNAIKYAESNGATGIVFDVCANPGGYLHLVTDMLSYLVPNKTPIASFSSSKAPIYAENDNDSSPLDHVLRIPSVVLCDKNSASAAELFAGAMRDYNDMGILKSTLVGEVTYKKGIMQSTLTFKDGSALTLTTALYNPPSGQNFHAVGVTPDRLITEGEDYMEVAIEELEKLTAEK